MDVVDVADGDPARVLGTFTTKESLVLKETVDPVRRANAANRGRGADTGCRGAVPPLAAAALLLRRAASWLREGGRVLLGFFMVANGVAEGSVFVGLIVVRVRVPCQTRHNGSFIYMYN